MGWLSWAAYPAVFMGILVAVTAVSILLNLPARMRMDPVDESVVPAAVRTRVAEYEALGFARIGPPRRVGTWPPAVMVALCHPDERTYATVYQVGGTAAYDCVALIEARAGGLTTGAEPRGDTLPLGPGNFRQVFPDAPPAELVARHREAMDFLRGVGVAFRAVSAETFEDAFVASFARQRRDFLRRPVRYVAEALWRTLAGRRPHAGSIRSQPDTPRQIASLSQLVS